MTDGLTDEEIVDNVFTNIFSAYIRKVDLMCAVKLARQEERKKHEAELMELRKQILEEVECRVVDSEKKEWWLEVVYKVGTPEMMKKCDEPENLYVFCESERTQVAYRDNWNASWQKKEIEKEKVSN